MAHKTSNSNGLPDIYYEYAKKDLKEERKQIRDRITVRLSQVYACALEEAALRLGIRTADILKRILVEDGILVPEDVAFSKKKKYISRYLDKIQLKRTEEGKRKAFHIPLSEYAKIKVYRAMIFHETTISDYFMHKLEADREICKYCTLCLLTRGRMDEA